MMTNIWNWSTVNHLSLLICCNSGFTACVGGLLWNTHRRVCVHMEGVGLADGVLSCRALKSMAVIENCAALRVFSRPWVSMLGFACCASIRWILSKLDVSGVWRLCSASNISCSSVFARMMAACSPTLGKGSAFISSISSQKPLSMSASKSKICFFLVSSRATSLRRVLFIFCLGNVNNRLDFSDVKWLSWNIYIEPEPSSFLAFSWYLVFGFFLQISWKVVYEIISIKS